MGTPRSKTHPTHGFPLPSAGLCRGKESWACSAVFSGQCPTADKRHVMVTARHWHPCKCHYCAKVTPHPLPPPETLTRRVLGSNLQTGAQGLCTSPISVCHLEILRGPSQHCKPGLTEQNGKAPHTLAASLGTPDAHS